MDGICTIEKYYVYMYAFINKCKYHENHFSHIKAWSEQHNQDMTRTKKDSFLFLKFIYASSMTAIFI